MDKQLLKAYIRTIVEEEIERLVPKLIKEHLTLSPSAQLVAETTATTEKPKMNRTELAALLGITRDGDMLRASTGNFAAPSQGIAPQGVAPEVAAALNKDYSQMMKTIDKVSKNKGY
jgi:hypothetical protein